MPEVIGKKLSDKGKFYKFSNVAILDGKRLPHGKFNGIYSKVSATDLGVAVVKGLLKFAKLLPDDIDQVIFANTIPSSFDSIFFARHLALKSGMNYETPASMSQRICASGLETVILAACDVGIGASKHTLAGGAENMTRAPLLSFELRNGFKLAASPFKDLLWEGLLDTYCKCSMGQTAENLAQKYNISRESADIFAFESHSRAIEANNKNIFNDEIIAYSEIVRDETIRTEVELGKLNSLKPVFGKNGVQTAGNSSQISDGAAAVIISDAEKASDPLGYILGATIIGEKPEIMGISPVKAVECLLKEFRLSINDIDLWEINEAFAAQYLAVEKVLGLNRDITNVNGGSIAIGHPLAATGTRLLITLLYELKRRKAKLGVVSVCVGGGQGVAVLVEANV